MQPQGKAAFSKCLVVGWALEVERLEGRVFWEGQGRRGGSQYPQRGFITCSTLKAKTLCVPLAGV